MNDVCRETLKPCHIDDNANDEDDDDRTLDDDYDDDKSHDDDYDDDRDEERMMFAGKL